jgi:hypothetical protein
MIWYFIIHCALLVGLFMWLDSRQAERYNLFAQWTQTSLMPQLGDVARSLENLPGEAVRQLELAPERARARAGGGRP